MITIVSVLGYFKVHGRAIESYPLAARVDEMGYSRKGTHVVVHHYARTVHTSTDSVIEHQWHAIVHQSLEMRIAHGILRL